MTTEKTEAEIKEDIEEELEEEGVSAKVAEKEVELAEDISEEQIEEKVVEPQTSADLKKTSEEEIKEDLEEEGVSEKVAEEEVEIAEDISEEQVVDEKLAEAESQEGTKEAKSLEERKKDLLAKVKKLAGKVDITKTEELKEKIKIKKREDMLIPLEEYVKSGIYLGTRAVTPKMKPYVYRRRADGLAIFNTDLIDEKLKEAVEFLSEFNPQDVIAVCKRQAGWKAVEMFGKITGIRVFTRKYPAGILTNTFLPDFFENELTIITDTWLDKNALNDTLNVKKKVLMVCDTNNFPRGTDNIIIGNNKSPRSLGIIFYLLTKGYCKAKGIEAEIPDLEWWVGDEEEKAKKKIRVMSKRTRFGS